MTTKAVAYIRVSTDEQEKTGYSIEAQRKAIDVMCATFGVEVVHRFEEFHSAKDEGRPEFDCMVQYLLAHAEVRAVAVDKTDRLSRNLIDMGVIRDRLGCRILSAKDPADDTPAGHFQQDIALAFASMYSKNLSMEVRKGLRAKFEAGGLVSKAPVGYRNIPRTRTERARVVVDEYAAPIVTRAFERYAAGTWSLTDIGLSMAEEGLVNQHRRPFSTEKVRQMLTCRVYLGLAVYGGEVRPGQHRALVTAEVFEKVQRALSERAVNHGEKGIKQFLLRGLLRCGACGRHVTAEDHTRGSYYRCVPRKDGTKCSQPLIRVDALDRELESYLDGLALTEDGGKALCAELDALAAGDATDREGNLATAKDKLGALDGKLTRLGDAFTSGDITREVYLTLRDQAMRERGLAEETISNLSGDTSADVASLKRFITLATSLRTLYDLAETIVDRKAVLATFFRRLVVTDKHLTDIEYHTPYNLLIGPAAHAAVDPRDLMDALHKT
ncbi:MAG: recombinase family protein [Thermoanaerobaculia bacterium]|jgi:DNA invertase Pin-like site-specific DNA recombinase